jgi:hypothetical protein
LRHAGEEQQASFATTFETFRRFLGNTALKLRPHPQTPPAMPKKGQQAESFSWLAQTGL